MIFYMGVLFAALLAWVGFKAGFYQIWTTLFNVLIAIYLAIHFSPLITEIIPAAGSTEIGKTLCMLITSGAIFLILHGFAYVFLLSQFSVTFPKILDTLGAAFLGFLTGFLIWSFVCLVICTGPIGKNAVVRAIGFDRQGFREAKMQSYLVWWSNLLDGFVVSGESRNCTERAVSDMLKSPVRRGRDVKPVQHSDVNAVCEPNSAGQPGQGQLPTGKAPPESHQDSISVGISPVD